jgi:Rieske Fe-S protein
MKLNPYNISFFSVLIFCALLLLPSCNENEEYIPYVPVDFTIDLDKRNDLTIPGNSDYNEYFGYAGVIVVCVQHDAVTPSNSIYYAYDAACTHEVSSDCPVISENNGINAICECCGSEYTLFGGVPIKGEASKPLKEYNTTVLGNKIRVYN